MSLLVQEPGQAEPRSVERRGKLERLAQQLLGGRQGADLRSDLGEQPERGGIAGCLGEIGADQMLRRVELLRLDECGGFEEQVGLRRLPLTAEAPEGGREQAQGIVLSGGDPQYLPRLGGGGERIRVQQAPAVLKHRLEPGGARETQIIVAEFGHLVLHAALRRPSSEGRAHSTKKRPGR